MDFAVTRHMCIIAFLICPPRPLYSSCWSPSFQNRSPFLVSWHTHSLASCSLPILQVCLSTFCSTYEENPAFVWVQLILLNTMISSFTHFPGNTLPVFTVEKKHCIYAPHFLYHSSADEYWSWFHLLAAVITTAIFTDCSYFCDRCPSISGSRVIR